MTHWRTAIMTYFALMYVAATGSPPYPEVLQSKEYKDALKTVLKIFEQLRQKKG